MKDQVFRVEYFAITADDKPGVGGELGNKLKQEGINLLALSVFPIGGGKMQVDLVPENHNQFVKAARKIGLGIGDPKVAFLAQGTDRAGALGDVLSRLGTANINVTATLGVAGGGNRYGALVWVDQADVDEATRALGATTLTAQHV